MRTRLLILLLTLCFAAPCCAANFADEPRLAAPAHADTMNDGREALEQFPWTSKLDIGRSPFGVTAGKDGLVPVGELPTARNQIVQNYQGTGILTTAQDGRIFDCISRHNYIGARLGSSDSEIRGCRLYNNRDACLWIAAGVGSANCQSTQNHCHTARIACYNEGSQAYRAVNDTYADSLIGYFGDVKVAGSHQTILTNVLFQHNMVCDCLLAATSGHLVNCIVNVQRDVNEWNSIDIPGVLKRSTKEDGKPGVVLASRCSIRGGVVTLVDWLHPVHTPSGKPCECVRIARGSELVVVDTSLVDNQNVDGAIGVRIAGPCSGLKVDCVAYGFKLPASRLLVIDDPAHTNGLDITFRINGATKPIGGYISTGAGWTGSIKVIDTATGKTMVLPQGKATVTGKQKDIEVVSPSLPRDGFRVDVKGY